MRDPIVSSYAKAYGADAAMATSVDAVQVFGGNGYVKEYPVEKFYRDARAELLAFLDVFQCLRAHRTGRRVRCLRAEHARRARR